MGLERYRPGRGEISSGGLHHGWSSMGNGSCHQGVAKNISAFAVQWLVFLLKILQVFVQIPAWAFKSAAHPTVHPFFGMVDRYVSGECKFMLTQISHYLCLELTVSHPP